MKAIVSDDYKKIVRTLKQARLDKGLTQRQLANKLNRSQSYISKIEQGQIRLDVIQVKQISSAVGVNFRRLLD